jgi:uncharacterized protein (DUF2267 family)
MGEATRRDAERAVRATLTSLAPCLSPEERARLRFDLPRSLRPVLATTAPTQPIQVDTFYRRVAEREGVELPVAVQHARAVCGAIWELLDPLAQNDLAAELWPEVVVTLADPGPHARLSRPEIAQRCN